MLKAILSCAQPLPREICHPVIIPTIPSPPDCYSNIKKQFPDRRPAYNMMEESKSKNMYYELLPIIKQNNLSYEEAESLLSIMIPYNNYKQNTPLAHNVFRRIFPGVDLPASFVERIPPNIPSCPKIGDVINLVTKKYPDRKPSDNMLEAGKTLSIYAELLPGVLEHKLTYEEAEAYLAFMVPYSTFKENKPLAYAVIRRIQPGVQLPDDE
jgi:hypothetical protein